MKRWKGFENKFPEIQILVHVERLRGFWIAKPTSFLKSGRKAPEYNDANIRDVFGGDYRIIYRIKRNSLDKNGKAMDSEC